MCACSLPLDILLFVSFDAAGVGNCDCAGVGVTDRVGNRDEVLRWAGSDWFSCRAGGRKCDL